MQMVALCPDNMIGRQGPRAAGPGLSAGTRRQSEAVADVAGRGGDRCRAGVPRRGTGREGLRPAPGGRERRAGCEAAYRVGLGVDLLRSQPAQRIPDHCRGVRRPSSRWRHRRVPWSEATRPPKPSSLLASRSIPGRVPVASRSVSLTVSGCHRQAAGSTARAAARFYGPSGVVPTGEVMAGSRAIRYRACGIPPRNRESAVPGPPGWPPRPGTLLDPSAAGSATGWSMSSGLRRRRCERDHHHQRVVIAGEVQRYSGAFLDRERQAPSNHQRAFQRIGCLLHDVRVTLRERPDAIQAGESDVQRPAGGRLEHCEVVLHCFSPSAGEPRTTAYPPCLQQPLMGAVIAVPIERRASFLVPRHTPLSHR